MPPQGLEVPGIPGLGKHPHALFTFTGGGSGGGGGTPSGMPSGAIGIWDASTSFVATPRKMIKNSVTNGANDQNLFSGPRRAYSSPDWNMQRFSGFAGTLTDMATTAPDGSNDAATYSNAAVGLWQVTSEGSGPYPAGTYTFAVSLKSMTGVNQSMYMRVAQSVEGNKAITITPTWARYTFTFTLSSSTFIGLDLCSQPGPDTQVNFAFIDHEVFSGSADLNPSPLTLAPLAIRNADMILGVSHYDTTANVVTNHTTNTTLATIQFSSRFTPSAFTFVAAFKQTAAPAAGGALAVMSKLQKWFGMGFGTSVNGASSGPLYWNSQPGMANNASGVQTSGSSWAPLGSGNVTLVLRYSGTRLSTFINGKRVSDGPLTLTPQSMQDFIVNAFDLGDKTGMEIGLLALYSRALTDVEARSCHSYLATTFGAPGVKQIVGLTGTSISALPIPSYYQQAGPELSPLRIISSEATASSDLNDGASIQAPALDMLITDGPTQDRYILMCEHGTNDLAQDGLTDVQLIAKLATYLDARRAAGWQKILQSTIMSREAATIGAYSKAQFDTYRASVNSAIRSWVGTRIDAVVDFAADSTMGQNTSSANTTYFADGVHPTSAGATIMKGIFETAINSIT